MTTSQSATPSLKETLEQSNQDLQKEFNDGEDISVLLKKRSQIIDGILRNMWQQARLDESVKASLVAVGGYGREEMHPASDVDLLILLADEPDIKEQELLSDFVTILWDLGLEIGHSVRTLNECIEEASNDLTVITNLIESRYLCGNKNLFEQLELNISSDKIWSSAAFFKAKIEEQTNRYKRYGDTAYRVEPNLKEGPGGLRDLQTIGWIFNREYGLRSLKRLSTTKEVHLLNHEEYQALIEARDFLWKVRFVLHQLTGKKTDRLLFDHQRHLAHSFGYTNDENNQSIESFMQRYYRNITKLERLNEVLLGLLREHILQSKQARPTLINTYYNNQGGYLGLEQTNLFSTQPHTLLEVFYIMQTRPEIKGLTPDTLRKLRQNLHLIDDDFRNNAHNKQMFITIMSETRGITFALRRMNRYGVLAAYIPAFANIVGRMQYDLFHAYTVDDHTLNVVRNIRRLSTQKGEEELPFCSKIFKTLQKPMILYLAGLFHDIAKGRGGSHSEKGAIDALDFCLKHDLSQYDAQTVSWLVQQHLLISSTAQRKDISDPDVIKEFANIVLTQNRLDTLYLLTICDIRGTNPTLLNSWKHSLLKNLYRATKKYLQNSIKNTESYIDNVKDIIKQKKNSILSQLEQKGFDPKECDLFWSQFSNSYILQHSVEDLVWHSTKIMNGGLQNKVDLITNIRENKRKEYSTLLIYTQDKKDIFVKIISAIEQHRLNIVAAHINSGKNGYALDSFFLLNADNKPLNTVHEKNQLLATVEKNLQQKELSYNFNHHRMPRQLKHFNSPTTVTFSQNKVMDKEDHRERTILTIRTGDSAGVLTRIGQVFYEQGLNIHNAKISTLGEIAEDIFHVTTDSGKRISDSGKQEIIRQALIERLDFQS